MALSFVLNAQSGEVVHVTSGTESYNLFQNAVILEDPQSELSISDILSGEVDDRFESTKGFIKVPAENKAFWLRVSVLSEVDLRLYTYQNYISTVEMILYEVADGKVVNKKVLSSLEGGGVKEEFRESLLYEDLLLKKGEQHDLILFARGVKLAYIPWFVCSEQAFIRQAHRNDLFYGFVYGLFILIIVYNLMIYIRIGERDYLFYSINMFFLGFLLFNFHGHPYEFVFTGHNYLKNYVDVYAALAGIFHVLFAMVFLRIKKFKKPIRVVFYILLIKYGIDIVACVTHTSGMAYPWLSSGTTAMLADLFIIIIGVYAAIQGFFPAILFVLARVALVISVFITAFYSMGKMTHSDFAYYALHVGAITEMILFAFAISYKIRLLKVEKERAQKEKEEYIQSQNILLEEKVKERTIELQEEQQKSERLLLNILPKTVAEELKQSGKSEARKLKNVTIIFTDFKNFTHSSQQIAAEDLIQELNVYFKAFDRIAVDYNLEKIKTIGDAYMAAGGISDEEDSAQMAVNVVKAALEMQRFVAEKRKAGSLILTEMRVGIHTGDVIAGVVGSTKFQYDIWGEAVNLAARMETSGESGRVNVSETTYQLIKPWIRCEYRGQIYAKNVGDVDMYFVAEEVEVTSD